jgi:hypothetical protein
MSELALNLSYPQVSMSVTALLQNCPCGVVCVTQEKRLIPRCLHAYGLVQPCPLLYLPYIDHVAPSIHKLALTSPTSSGRSVGIVRSLTQTTEFFVYDKFL